MNKGHHISEAKLEKAVTNAKANWLFWQKDFEHDMLYKDLPILNDPHRFLAFGFDFFLFRLYDRGELEGIRETLKNIETREKTEPKKVIMVPKDVEGFAAFHSGFSKRCVKKVYQKSKKSTSQCSRNYCVFGSQRCLLCGTRKLETA